MQENVTETQVNEMLQLADLDKDGKINYEGNKNRSGRTASAKGNHWLFPLFSLAKFKYQEIKVLRFLQTRESERERIIKAMKCQAIRLF